MQTSPRRAEDDQTLSEEQNIIKPPPQKSRINANPSEKSRIQTKKDKHKA